MGKTEMEMFKNSKVKLMSETTGNAQYWQLCLSFCVYKSSHTSWSLAGLPRVLLVFEG